MPSDTDWINLINYLGGKEVAGGKLKEDANIHWEDPNEGANNISGMSIVAGGYRTSYPPGYLKLGYEGYYWSSSSSRGRENFGWYIFLNYDSQAAFIENITLSDKNQGYSVRCIKN